MTLLSPPFALGAAGQVLSGKLLRLSLGAAYRSAAAGVQGVSGVLYGPAGTMGELTLNSNTSLTINPFRAVVQQAQDTTQGQYLVVNDAAVTATTAVVAGVPTMPAQDASQFRRAYIATYVADSQVSGVASSGVTDRSVLDILPGALAASAGVAAYPAVPANALLLGELLFPPVGQAVTLTAYNPRTTTRGGILPVIADGVNRPGHDGELPLYDGQPRYHPTLGFQLGKGGAWANPGNGGTGTALAGTAPPAGAQLVTKAFWLVPPNTNSSGDSTMPFAGGAFPNGLVSVNVNAIGNAAVPGNPPSNPGYYWMPFAPTLASVTCRLYATNGAAGVGPGGIMAATIVAVGW